MSVYYHLVGIAASLGAALSRARINFVSCSVVPITVALFGIAFGVMAIQTLVEGPDPHRVALGEFVKEYYLGPSYVTVQGEFVPEFVYDVRPRNDGVGSTTRRFVALANRDQGGVVMVEMNDSSQEPLTGVQEVTGTVEPMGSSVRLDLPEKIMGVPVNQDHYVVVGGVPLSLAVSGPIGLVGVAAMALYMPAFAGMYIVFRRDRGQVGAPGPASAVGADISNVRVSGRFALEARAAQRFLDVPVMVEVMTDGSVVAFANVDASVRSSFYFIPTGTENRSGWWSLMLVPGSIRQVEWGTQYLGGQSRPAVRLRFYNATWRLWDMMVMSFASADDRAAVMSVVSNPQEFAPRIGADQPPAAPVE